MRIAISVPYLSHAIRQAAHNDRSARYTRHVDNIPFGLHEGRYQQPGEVVHRSHVHLEHLVEGLHVSVLYTGPRAHARVVHEDVQSRWWRRD